MAVTVEGSGIGRGADAAGEDGIGGYAFGHVHFGDGLAVLESLPAGSVDAVVTDPPYGVLAAANRWDYDIDAGRLLGAAARALKPEGALVSFGRGLFLAELVVRACREHGYTFKEELVWHKMHGGGVNTNVNRTHELAVVLGRKRFKARRVLVDAVEQARYRPRVLAYRVNELAALAKRPDDLERLERLAAYVAARPGGAEGGVTMAEQRRFFEVKRRTEFGFVTLDKSLTMEKVASHAVGKNLNLFIGGRMQSVMDVSKSYEYEFAPTAKPVALLRQFVRLATDRGGVVVDPYAGGGSTVIACIKEGRRGVGVELNPAQRAVAEGRCAAARGGRCACGDAGQHRKCEACLAAARAVHGEDLKGRETVRAFDARAALAGMEKEKAEE